MIRLKRKNGSLQIEIGKEEIEEKSIRKTKNEQTIDKLLIDELPKDNMEKVKDSFLFFLTTILSLLALFLVGMVFFYLLELSAKKILADNDKITIGKFEKEFSIHNYSDINNKDSLIKSLRTKGKINIKKETLNKIGVEDGGERFFLSYKTRSDEDCKFISRAGKKVREITSLYDIPENIHVPVCVRIGNEKESKIILAIHTEKGN